MMREMLASSKILASAKMLASTKDERQKIIFTEFFDVINHSRKNVDVYEIR